MVYLLQAVDIGVAISKTKDKRDILEAAKEIKPQNSDIKLILKMFKACINLTDKFDQIVERLLVAEKYRDYTMQAAIHKLGAMLAITDQIAFDARETGIAVPASYKPEDPGGVRHKNYLDMFGEEMPSVQVVIEQAVDIFTNVADPNDQLVNHLFGIDFTRHLAK